MSSTATLLESEAALENKLLETLSSNGYERVSINNTEELENNFKKQLELHNKIELTDQEFKSVLNYLDGGSIFHKSIKLRDKFEINREDGTKYIEFIDQVHWSKNIFQVTSQITDKGKYETRYDVTILINGLKNSILVQS